MDFEPIKIRLKSPLKHGTEEIAELVFGREMVAGDLRGISIRDLTHDNVCDVASRITGVPAPILRQLKMPDYLEVAEVVSGFFGYTLPTGEKQ